LKRAYRKAAALTHPDRGGTVEDFQAVQAAYDACDLTSLNEFFLLQEESLQDRIEYWLQQPAAAHVEWIRFQATNEYAVVAMYQRGQRDEAIELAGKFLRLALVVAEREERDLLCSMSSYSITVNKHHEGSHIG
jgi:curved DNA-binding protein CbpA